MLQNLFQYMKLTKEQVKHVATLARLALSDEDIDRYTRDLAAIIEYVEKLNEVDTSDVEETFHTIPIKNVLREDEVRESFKAEELLNGAPDHDSRAFRVPKIIEAT